MSETVVQRLMRGTALGVVWISTAGAIYGFVLPWASIDMKAARLVQSIDRVAAATPLQDLTGTLTKEAGRVVGVVRRGTETVTGALPDLSAVPTQVNGPQIPQMANRQDAKIVLALTEMLTGQQQLGAKSYAVYVLPTLALVCGVLVTLARTHRVLCGLLGLLCVAISATGFWKLLTTQTDTLLVAITIGPGLWLSCWSYLGLGVAAWIVAGSAPGRRPAS